MGKGRIGGGVQKNKPTKKNRPPLAKDAKKTSTEQAVSVPKTGKFSVKSVAGKVMNGAVYPTSAVLTLLNPPPWVVDLAKKLVAIAIGTLSFEIIKGESVKDRDLRAERISAIPLAETAVIVLLLEHRAFVYRNRNKLGRLYDSIARVVGDDFGAHSVEAIRSLFQQWVLQLKLEPIANECESRESPRF